MRRSNSTSGPGETVQMVQHPWEMFVCFPTFTIKNQLNVAENIWHGSLWVWLDVVFFFSQGVCVSVLHLWKLCAMLTWWRFWSVQRSWILHSIKRTTSHCILLWFISLMKDFCPHDLPSMKLTATIRLWKMLGKRLTSWAPNLEQFGQFSGAKFVGKVSWVSFYGHL